MLLQILSLKPVFQNRMSLNVEEILSPVCLRWESLKPLVLAQRRRVVNE